jgi:hypothetical protein
MQKGPFLKFLLISVTFLFTVKKSSCNCQNLTFMFGFGVTVLAVILEESF